MCILIKSHKDNNEYTFYLLEFWLVVIMAKSSKSTTGKRKHEDRNAVSKVAFEPINIEAKVPNTVVLLLSSDEESVLLQVSIE